MIPVILFTKQNEIINLENKLMSKGGGKDKSGGWG